MRKTKILKGKNLAALTAIRRHYFYHPDLEYIFNCFFSSKKFCLHPLFDLFALNEPAFFMLLFSFVKY